MISTIASTYLAGFLTSLTPCVYPLIPLSLGYLGSQKDGLKRSTVVSFSFGQMFMFSLLGLIAVQVGDVFGSLSENVYLQFGMAGLLLIFAYYSWFEKLPAFLQKFNNIGTGSEKPTSAFGAFTAGFLSAVVASPCSTPVLAGVLVMISQAENRIEGMSLMFVYGAGISTIFLILGLGLLKATQLPKSGNWLRYAHKLSVLMLVASAGYFISKGMQWI